ncbi:MAG: transglutaminase family protein [Ferruginibacter sp.]
MPKFIIQHTTKYTYPEFVRDSANQIMLYPIKDENQEVQSQQLHITNEPFVETFRDYYGNEAGSFMNIAPHKELVIQSTIAVVTKSKQFPNDSIAIEEQWNHLLQIKNIVPFIDFLRQENFEALPEVKKIADAGFYKSVSVYVAAMQLVQYVYDNYNYIQGVTTVETTLDEIWNLKAGVCQDFAHMLLVLLRLLNIPARYVSGYVCPRDSSLRGEGATHAWVEAYIPFYGWLGLDPTNNCIADDQHVRLAIGRSFSDCSPVKGTYKGTAKQTLEVSVSVSHEDGVVSNVGAVLVPLNVKSTLTDGAGENNSYRKFMQQQQQQQQ